MHARPIPSKFLMGLTKIVLCLLLSGCTATQESETLSALEAALTSLNQNRTLMEQYARDIQSRIDPSSDVYLRLRTKYDIARDDYNQYLDDAERAVLSKHRDNDLRLSARSARDSSAEFLATATRALDAQSPLRGVEFRRAIDLPDSLVRDLRHVPKSSRQEMIDVYAPHLKVRSWANVNSDPRGDSR